MLVQLLPEQVSARWDNVGEMIKRSLPEAHRRPDAMKNILRSVMTERATVWVYKDGGMKALTLTAVDVDPVTGARNLLIYALYSVNKISREMLLDGLETLMGHAKAENCGAIVAYTNQEGIAKVMKTMGARVDYARIEIDL